MDIISIIIPCYNGEAFVKEAIDSVKAQTSDKWECVIVDDGSTDESGSIIDNETDGDKRFIVRHIENGGVANARNVGILVASGKYILPLDADDKLRPQAIERFFEFWYAHPDASLLVPARQNFDEDGPIKIQKRKWKGFVNLTIQCTPQNTSCYRKSDWQRVGGYRDGTMYEDWEFWLRLLHGNAHVVNIDEVLVDYRVRKDSRVHEADKRRALEVLKIKKMNPQIYKRLWKAR
jgi:glycosyltransferase involved in cell wall biosynthesis